MAEHEGQELDLGPWGRGFVLAETERRFHAWRAEQTLRQARIALVLGVVALCLYVFGIGAATPPDLAMLGELVFGGAVPVIGFSLVAGYTPRARRWFFPLCAVSNTASVLVIIASTRALHEPSPNFAATVGLTAFVMTQYFAFTLQRLRPRDAAIAAVVAQALFAATWIDWWQSGKVHGSLYIAGTSALLGSFLTGLIACVFSEHQLRSSYRQERIIEAQRETIARERARSEDLLKQELSHQVAARSRELGRMLAQVEVASSPRRPIVGGRFDTRYRVVRELGAGGMGAVYEVERSTDGQRLALKVVTGELSPARAARFAREAEIGARVHHPNVISIVDVGIADGIPFLAMELAPKGSLEDRRAEFGKGSWTPILLDVALGLAALHEASVVHRDLKPANVLLVERDGERAAAKISDFGISRFGELDSLDDVDPEGATLAAKRTTHALTATGMLLGTPNYMAPETAAGARVESPADVFSFGILACELFTGRSPFSRLPILSALAAEPVRAPAGVDDPRIPESLRATIRACLSEDPAERPTIREVVARLE